MIRPRSDSSVKHSIFRRAARRWRRGCAALVALGVVAGPVARLRGDVTPEQIDNAIEKGKAYLYSQMHGANWETDQQPPLDPTPGLGGQWGGQTAICLYTLLAAGENSQDPKLKKAIEWLGNADAMKGIYAVGMRANVWNQIDEKLRKKPPYSLAIQRDMDILLQGVRTKNAQTSGMYDYFKDNGDRIDHSVSQYGVLGMWAVADSEIGVEIDSRFWKVVEDGWIRDQEKFDVDAYMKLSTDKRTEVTAGWHYERGAPKPGAAGRAASTTASMTAAGVASLFITQDQLHFAEGLDCKGNIFNPHIEAGLNWLAKNFNQVQNNYTWYGIERIGTASGRKYFGKVDWFKQGADHLVKSQGPGGGWGNEHGSVANTCFAIMFLERGRSPVIMNKLQYAIFTNGDTHKEASWNERARDVANLAKHSGKAIERFLNWQVVDLSAPPEELHDAPILYISGSKEGLFFSPEEEGKIKKFVEQGGLIVGNADCGSAQFSNAFRKLGTKLFANEFRKLELDHLIYHENGKAKQSFVPMEALSNGARELMILFPTADPARLWQVGAYSGKEQFHNVALNIFLYTTEKLAPRTKGETYIVHRNATPATRPPIKIARVAYTAGDMLWNPEPYGWERLSNILHNDEKIDATVETVPLGKGKLDPAAYKVAHITGIFSILLNDAQRAELKDYVEKGGTLIIDACGGSPKFAQLARGELAKIWPNDPLQAVPANSPVLQSAKVKADTVVYRKFATPQLGGNLHQPRIQAITLNGRPAVFFSAEDLSVGLVGQTVDGIVGYAAAAGHDKEGKIVHAGASEVMANLVMFAAGDAKPLAAANEKK